MSSAPPTPWLTEASLWQLVESGGYRADLPVLLELAGTEPKRILDLGCGTGRIAHPLAAAGHQVVGLELDPGIAADFNRIATEGELDARCIPGDALGITELELGTGLDLALAPMQLVQILGDESERSRLFAGITGKLAPGGRVAIAISPDLAESSLELDLTPDLREFGGWVYSSRPLSIEAAAGHIELTRLRSRVSPAGDLTESTTVIRFERVATDRLERELEAAGFRPGRRLEVAATRDHIGSVIVTAGRYPDLESAR